MAKKVLYYVSFDPFYFQNLFQFFCRQTLGNFNDVSICIGNKMYVIFDICDIRDKFD